MSAEEATEAMEKVVLGEDGQPLSKNAQKKLEKVCHSFLPSQGVCGSVDNLRGRFPACEDGRGRHQYTTFVALGRAALGEQTADCRPGVGCAH